MKSPCSTVALTLALLLGVVSGAYINVPCKDHLLHGVAATVIDSTCTQTIRRLAARPHARSRLPRLRLWQTGVIAVLRS
jgi:hypothetical protein